MEGRPGGFTRITKLGQRRGDGADMAILEWIGEGVTPATAETVAEIADAAAPEEAKQPEVAEVKSEETAE